MESPRAWSDKYPQSRDGDVQVFTFLELTLLWDQECPNLSSGPIVQPATTK